MSNLTLRVIKTLKQGQGSNLYMLMKAWAKEYDRTIEECSYDDIERMLKETFLDYIAHCDNYIEELFRLFNKYEPIHFNNEIDKMCSFFRTIQVREQIENSSNYRFINGFNLIYENIEI